jgi:hypothetical protein
VYERGEAWLVAGSRDRAFQVVAESRWGFALEQKARVVLVTGDQ